MNKRNRQPDNVPALFDLTLYTVEPAGEYVPDPSWERFDSLTEVKHLENDSLTPDQSAVSESNDIDQSAVSESKSGCISTYSPGGTARCDRKYFRYSWRVGNKIHHAHIPGGNTHNSIAQQRAQKVREAIARGEQPREIVNKFLKN